MLVEDIVLVSDMCFDFLGWSGISHESLENCRLEEVYLGLVKAVRLLSREWNWRHQSIHSQYCRMFCKQDFLLLQGHGPCRLKGDNRLAKGSGHLHCRV